MQGNAPREARGTCTSARYATLSYFLQIPTYVVHTYIYLSKLTKPQAEEILNKQSGWKALTGTTDFSQIAVPNPPSAAHKLAFDIFVDRIVGYVASYFVKLDGAVDAIVFAGGIGERSAMLRQAIVEKVRCLGVPPVDEGANERGFGDEEGKNVVDVSGGPEGPRVLVCQTDEQVSPFLLVFPLLWICVC